MESHENVAGLVEAVTQRDFSRVRLLLNARPQLVHLDLAENDERRALHFAVLQRDSQMVRLLMEAGADAHKGVYPHRDATSAWVIAHDREYPDVLAVLEAEEQQRRAELSCPNATVLPVQEQISRAIHAGANQDAITLLEADRSLVQACDRSGSSPLHVAAGACNLEMVRWLLKARADARREDANCLLPIDRAAWKCDGHFDTVARLLLEHGSPVTLRTAVALGDIDRIRELAATAAHQLRAVNRDGGLLTIAVKHRQLASARVLLDLGVDVDERVHLPELEGKVESWGFPLWHAALLADASMTALLLERGADANANVYASGWPLRNAWNHDDPTVKQMLIARGARVHPYMLAESHDSAGAHHLLNSNPSPAEVEELAVSAADHGSPQILAAALLHLPREYLATKAHWLLIQPIRGAGADEDDNQGHYKCLRLLLEAGANPNAHRFGQTAIHFAAGYRGAVGEQVRARLAEILLDAGTDLNTRDELLQSTPLGWACRWGRVRLAELLIGKGAAIEEPDAEPWTQPLNWAKKYGRDLLAHALLNHVRQA